ncbi:MAG: SusC/RagA family TonB-linked outer membrane protein, partial [Cytophagaceae bacterium]
MNDKPYSTVGQVVDSSHKPGVNASANLWKAVFTLLMLFTVSFAFAQEATVSGKVTDSGAGIGLPGVTVQVKGQTRGITTDADGNYRLSGVGPTSVLVFSSIGYTPQEVTVGSRQTVNISLAEDNKTLSEVVVVGYGTQRAKDVTGSVATLGPKDFN